MMSGENGENKRKRKKKLESCLTIGFVCFWGVYGEGTKRREIKRDHFVGVGIFSVRRKIALCVSPLTFLPLFFSTVFVPRHDEALLFSVATPHTDSIYLPRSAVNFFHSQSQKFNQLIQKYGDLEVRRALDQKMGHYLSWISKIPSINSLGT